MKRGDERAGADMESSNSLTGLENVQAPEGSLSLGVGRRTGIKQTEGT